VIRDLTSKTKVSFLDTMRRNDATLMASIPGASKSAVRRVNTFLSIGAQTDVEDALESIARMELQSAVFYVEALEVNMWDRTTETLRSTKPEQQLAAIDKDAEKEHVQSLSAKDKLTWQITTKGSIKSATLGRQAWWSGSFRRGVSQCATAIFVIDGAGEGVAPPVFEDLQWLYALFVAESAPRPQVTFAITNIKPWEAMLHDDIERRIFLRQLRGVSVENATSPVRIEETAIRAAIGLRPEQRSRADWYIMAALLRFVKAECWRLVDSFLNTVDSPTLDLKVSIWKLQWSAIELELEYANHMNQGRPGPPESAVALARAEKLVDWSKSTFKDETDMHVLEARLMLANVMRQRGRDSDRQEAYTIYVELAKAHKEGAERIFGHASSEEKLVGCETLAGNALREMGEYKKAEGHYRTALDLSQEHLGKQHVNTYYCMSNLANCLRAINESARNVPKGAMPDAEAMKGLREAEQLLHKAVKGYTSAQKKVNPRAIAAKVNRAVLLVDLAADSLDAEQEATKVLDEVLSDCVDYYGEGAEITTYVKAKQAEVQLRYGQQALNLDLNGPLNTPVAALERALKRFKALGLPDNHPRVEDVKTARKRRGAAPGSRPPAPQMFSMTFGGSHRQLKPQ